MQKFKYKGKTIVASTMKQAIHKIVANSNSDLAREIAKNLQTDLVVKIDYLALDVGRVFLKESSYDNYAEFDVCVSAYALESEGNCVPMQYLDCVKEYIDDNDDSDSVLNDLTINFKFKISVDDGNVNLNVDSELLDTSVVTKVICREDNLIQSKIDLKDAEKISLNIVEIFKKYLFSNKCKSVYKTK